MIHGDMGVACLALAVANDDPGMAGMEAVDSANPTLIAGMLDNLPIWGSEGRVIIEIGDDLLPTRGHLILREVEVPSRCSLHLHLHHRISHVQSAQGDAQSQTGGLAKSQQVRHNVGGIKICGLRTDQGFLGGPLISHQVSLLVHIEAAGVGGGLVLWGGGARLTGIIEVEQLREAIVRVQEGEAYAVLGAKVLVLINRIKLQLADILEGLGEAKLLLIMIWGEDTY